MAGIITFESDAPFIGINLAAPFLMLGELKRVEIHQPADVLSIRHEVRTRTTAMAYFGHFHE